MNPLLASWHELDILIDFVGKAVEMWGWVFDDFTRILGAFWEENGFLGWQSDIDDGNMPTHWCYPPTEEKVDD
jgi:hypothetical protein